MRQIRKLASDAAAAVILYPIIAFYRFFCGWWLDDVLDRHSERLLKNRTVQSFPFLFEEYRARFVPNDRGYEWTKGKMISLEAGNVRFRVSRDRGDDSVDVAPIHAPTDWEPLAHAVMAVAAKRPIRSKDDLPSQLVFPELSELGTWLKPYFRDLERAYASHNYSDTKLTIQMVQSLPGLGKWGRFVKVGTDETRKTHGERIQTLGL